MEQISSIPLGGKPSIVGDITKHIPLSEAPAKRPVFGIRTTERPEIAPIGNNLPIANQAGQRITIAGEPPVAKAPSVEDIGTIKLPVEEGYIKFLGGPGVPLKAGDVGSDAAMENLAALSRQRAGIGEIPSLPGDAAAYARHRAVVEGRAPAEIAGTGKMASLSKLPTPYSPNIAVLPTSPQYISAFKEGTQPKAMSIGEGIAQGMAAARERKRETAKAKSALEAEKWGVEKAKGIGDIAESEARSALYKAQTEAAKKGKPARAADYSKAIIDQATALATDPETKAFDQNKFNTYVSDLTKYYAARQKNVIPEYSQEDLEYTAKEEGLTVDEVRKRLEEGYI